MTQVVIRPVRALGAVLLAASLVAGCSSSGGSSGSSTSAPTKAASEEEQVLAESVELSQASFDEQLAAMADLDSGALDWFLESSGLSSSLSADEARAFYTDVAEQLDGLSPEDLGTVAEAERPPGAKAWRSDEPNLPPGSVSGLAMGWFELYLLGGMGVGAISQEGDGHHEIPGEGGPSTIDASASGLVFDMKHTKTIDGITAKMANRLAVETCPDAQGVVTIDAKIDSSMYREGSREGGRSELSFTVSGQVDDNADLVSADTDFRVQVSDTAPNGKGRFVDLSGAISQSGYDGKERTANFTKAPVINRTGGSITSEQVAGYFKLTSFLMFALQETIIQKAQDHWKSGKCIDLQVSSDPAKRTGLDPSTAVKVTATPKAKADGAMAGGTVTAELKGGSSISPTGKVEAAATFDYVAPGEKDQEASIAFESRSKRGVGKATASFDTKDTGYTASGGGPEVTITGRVDDVTKPFELQGTCIGCTAVFTFTPTSDKGGTYVANISGGGFTGSVKGSYTLTGTDGGPLVIKTDGGGCVNGVAGSCRNRSETITLTPDS